MPSRIYPHKLLPQETKEKIRQSVKKAILEKRLLIVGFLNRGRKLSKEQKRKLSQFQEETQQGAQTLLHHRYDWTGKHFTEEHKKNLSGEKNHSWKGGKCKFENRWFIRKPTHPFAKQNGYIRHSRLIAEKYLGRYLTKQEVIHHINEIMDDDKPENLYLFPLDSLHRQYHRLQNKPQLISNIIDF